MKYESQQTVDHLCSLTCLGPSSVATASQ